MEHNVKFRGYDTDSKEWRYGYYLHKTDTILCAASEEEQRKNSHHLILFGGFCDWNMPRPYYQSEVANGSVGRYTGKCDNSGREVYEGDIITNSHGVKMEIKYGTYTAYCPVDQQDMDSVGFYAYAPGFPDMPIGCLETYATVIGNVWENPDLLHS